MVSCTGKRQQAGSGTGEEAAEVATGVEHAQGFTLAENDGVTLLTVSNPWQGAQHVTYRYALCGKEKEVPAELSGYTVIRTPVERVVCLSTTHVAMLSAIGKTHTVKALSGSEYVSDPEVVRAVASGETVDIGYEASLNFEKIIALKPDVIFAYGVGQEVLGSLRRLTDLGLTVVFNAEYLERTALGKAEWIRFMAAFYGEEDRADSLFGNICRSYDSLKQITAGMTDRPAVMCGLPWQGSWYIPGGRSSIAAMIADAGGNYLWKENTSHESYPVDIEAIIDKGAAADFWINTGAAGSLSEIRSVDERLALARPWKTGQVYNNYARASAGGGNDYFESGIVRPHVILKDMIGIFHPDVLPGHSFYYYMKLN
ncbi:MAG: ABC transporter substrate-binding protein [Bacteroidales bacterium]|nr:ABC transporter substrate-binding protein [Bacteroidales bacterium]